MKAEITIVTNRRLGKRFRCRQASDRLRRLQSIEHVPGDPTANNFRLPSSLNNFLSFLQETWKMTEKEKQASGVNGEGRASP